MEAREFQIRPIRIDVTLFFNIYRDSVFVTFPIDTGSLRDFPFDSYSTDFPLKIYQSEDESPVAFSVSVQCNSQNVRIEAFKDRDGMYRIDIKRPTTSMLFCIFLILLMWFMSISILNLSYDILVQKREIEPVLLTLGPAMLFALPGIRDSQPGIPLIGCLSDVLGFFWNIFITATSTIVIVYAYTLRWSPHQLDRSVPIISDNEKKEVCMV